MGQLHNFWRAYSSFVACVVSFTAEWSKSASDAMIALVYDESMMTLECFEIVPEGVHGLLMKSLDAL